MAEPHDKVTNQALLLQIVRDIEVLKQNSIQILQSSQDHETRIRNNEAAWQSMAQTNAKLAEIDKRLQQTERKVWLAYGGLATVVSVLEIIWRVTGK